MRSKNTRREFAASLRDGDEKKRAILLLLEETERVLATWCVEGLANTRDFDGSVTNNEFGGTRPMGSYY
jgi:hypothetical protein